MPQVHIPDTLFHRIEEFLPGTISADEFVVEAVREKLTLEDHKKEFFRLSGQTRAAMDEKGLTVSEILAEFQSVRKGSGG
jgi:hypothetical protein